MRAEENWAGMQSGPSIIGYRVGGAPSDEEEHFEPCPICGQSFDMRDLAQVMHHAESNHDPLPENETRRVVEAGELLTKALRG